MRNPNLFNVFIMDPQLLNGDVASRILSFPLSSIVMACTLYRTHFIPHSQKMFVGGLSWDTTEGVLPLFAPLGLLLQKRLYHDTDQLLLLSPAQQTHSGNTSPSSVKFSTATS